MSDSNRTVEFLRILSAPPERVFRAFSEPDAKVRWEPPFGFIGKVHSWDFREGGSYQMSFINFSTGKGHTFGGRFLEIVENETLKVTDAFEDANLPGEMVTTIKLREVLNGTELRVTQAGVPDAIPLEFCYAGWQQSMTQLAQLVEADIPDEPV